MLPPCTHPSLGISSAADGAINTVAVPLSLVASIESSGKWPDDKTATIKTKLALLIRIGNLLEDQFQIKSLIRSERVCLDVAFGGYMYRLYLNHQHEFQIKFLNATEFFDEDDAFLYIFTLAYDAVRSVCFFTKAGLK